MTITRGAQKLIKRYLLGELTTGSMHLVEIGILQSAEWFEELLIGEEELIDQYVTEGTDHNLGARFEVLFLSTPERQTLLRFAMAFHRYLSSESY
jgi:hypothetical protein